LMRGPSERLRFASSAMHRGALRDANGSNFRECSLRARGVAVMTE
jgi:hypothetical protein